MPPFCLFGRQKNLSVFVLDFTLHFVCLVLFTSVSVRLFYLCIYCYFTVNFAISTLFQRHNEFVTWKIINAGFHSTRYKVVVHPLNCTYNVQHLYIYVHLPVGFCSKSFCFFFVIEFMRCKIQPNFVQPDESIKFVLKIKLV